MEVYVPKKMDIIWLDFEPQIGREISKRRPALVISPSEYNAKTKLAVLCPITSKVKEYPFEVRLPEGLPVEGVILADQVKSLDWSIRKASFECVLPVIEFNMVIDKINLLIHKVSLTTSRIVEILKPLAPDTTINNLTLGFGRYQLNDPYQNFPYRTSFRGYLINSVSWGINLEEDPSFTIGSISQELYYSDTHQKILLYNFKAEYTVGCEASIIEVKNLRELINRYPLLSKQLGLPVPLPPDDIPLEESIHDSI